MWINADRSVHRAPFPSVRRGIRWHRKVWILEQKHQTMKEQCNRVGPEEVGQVIQLHSVWLRDAAQFLFYHGAMFIPEDLKNHYNEAFLLVLELHYGGR